MELKSKNVPVVLVISLLPIAPNGIEIISFQYHAPTLLLPIAPNGIEIEPRTKTKDASTTSNRT